MPGVVHGASGTGQTVFLEPFETVEPNNQLVQLAEDEAAEILRDSARTDGTPAERFAGRCWPPRRRSRCSMAFLRARDLRGISMPRCRNFLEHGELRLEAARHPVLEDKLRRENRAIVPMSLTLGGEERVLVISGPNTGGKTVALKTTGMAALSAQSGIPVAAQTRGAAAVRSRAGGYRR